MTVLDLVFVALVVAFFAIAAVFIRACELIAGSDSSVEEGRQR